MADTVVDVVVQIAGEDVPAGRLWSHRARRGESATFAYSPEYLKRDDSYELDPLLPKNTGQQQTPEGRALFGALSDAAPDGWGRRLIRRREIHHAEEHKTAERDIAEIEYLLGVRDGLRQGALRLRDPDTGGYLAEEVADTPQLLDLSRLLDAAEQLERHEDTAEDLRLLLDGGSSLGGARPKAHVIDPGGHIGIAKFPAPETDRWDVIRWEAVALTLAREAGVSVPEFQLHEITKRPVLIVRRFDRDTGGRIGYLSAMTMLEASDGGEGTYLEIAETIEEHSPAASKDLQELWRRIAFTRLISNTDDHLRNHGFLRTSTAGWSLSPAFDLNPNPQLGKAYSTVIDERQSGSEIQAAMELAEMFRLSADESRAILGQVRAATSRWREVAQSLKLNGEAIRRMAPAFEGAEARAADVAFDP
jgi:serine/threonine-protein kinase HipA